MIALFFAVAMLVPLPSPEPELMIESVKARPLNEKGLIQLSIRAVSSADGQVFVNRIFTKVDPTLFARELRVLDSRHATPDPGQAQPNPKSLFLAY